MLISVVSTLLRLATIPSPEIKSRAISIISSCAQDAKFRTTLRDGGALTILVESLFDKEEKIQETAAIALSHIVTSERDAEAVFGFGTLFIICLYILTYFFDAIEISLIL